jgi:hypothetical protein
VNDGMIPAYQIGGMYLRFKEENIFALRSKFGGEPVQGDLKKSDKIPEIKSPFMAGIRDFLYFNDFYIISGMLIIFLVFIILRVIR